MKKFGIALAAGALVLLGMGMFHSAEALNATVGTATCAGAENVAGGNAEVYVFVLRGGNLPATAADTCYVINNVANCGGSQAAGGTWAVNTDNLDTPITENDYVIGIVTKSPAAGGAMAISGQNLLGAGGSTGFRVMAMQNIGLPRVTPTRSGFDVKMDDLIEFENPITGAITCYPGGRFTARGAKDFIAGYNVYRMETAPTTVQQVVDLAARPVVNNWVGFIDNTTFNFAIADPGANDSNLRDLGAPIAADADPVTPDDVRFQDSVCMPDAAAPEPLTAGCVDANADTVPDNPNQWGPVATAPPGSLVDPGHTYYYLYQPVINVRVPAFQTIQLEGDAAASDRRLDLDGDTVMESVNLDNVNTTAECINPRKDGGTMYCGLTFGGRPLLSAFPTAGFAANPALAERLDFSSVNQANGLLVRFRTAVESNVAGFNVYRSVLPSADSKYVKVNDALIGASGLQGGNEYTFLDTTVRLPRRASVGTFFYKVEVVTMDGQTVMVGPFRAVYTSSDTRGQR